MAIGQTTASQPLHAPARRPFNLLDYIALVLLVVGGLNWGLVGLLQVVTPTYLIINADGDSTAILAASGLYLFGFTYLYVAWNLLAGLDGSGLGMFSLFVAIAAVVYSAISFDAGDPVFGVIWLYWAYLWLLFYLLLARGKEAIGRYTGAVAAIQGWVTGALPAFLLLTGNIDFVSAETFATVLAVLAVVAFGGLAFMMRAPSPAAPATPATPAPAP